MNGSQSKKALQPDAPQKDQTPSSAEEARLVAYSEHHSGPLPPPAVLQRYDQIVPGAAERIIKMAEEQSAHRRNVEQRVIYTNTLNSRLGVVFGFIIGSLGITLPIIYKIPGAPIISVASLASLVGVFIHGTSQRRSEREERRKEVQESGGKKE